MSTFQQLCKERRTDIYLALEVAGAHYRNKAHEAEQVGINPQGHIAKWMRYDGLRKELWNAEQYDSSLLNPQPAESPK